jgi:ABC-2 type transport system permease protein
VTISGLTAVARREYFAFFRTPLGWCVLALFLLLSGAMFSRLVLMPGEPATMRDFFSFWWRVLLVICPAISMRLMSDELRSGTIDPLMSSPVHEAGLIGGKYLAACGFLLTCLACTLVYPVLLVWLSKVDLGPIAAGYLGVSLLGMYQLALGLVFSTLTSSQTLAFLATVATILLMEVGIVRLAEWLSPPWDSWALGLSIDLRLADFAKGLIDLQHVGFFVIVSLWLVVLASCILRLRRLT